MKALILHIGSAIIKFLCGVGQLILFVCYHIWACWRRIRKKTATPEEFPLISDESMVIGLVEIVVFLPIYL